MTLLLVLLLSSQAPVEEAPAAPDAAAVVEAPGSDGTEGRTVVEGVDVVEAPATPEAPETPAQVEPSVDGAGQSAHDALRVPGCRVHAPSRLDRAEACYRGAIDRTPDDDAERVAVLLALADATVALRLHQKVAVEEGPQWVAAVTSGTVEMIGFSVVGGAISASLFAGATAVAIGNSGGGGGQVAALLTGFVLLSPLVGAAAGGTLSLWPVVAGARVTAGDAALVRSGWILGATNAFLLPFLNPFTSPGAAAQSLVGAGAVMAGGAGLGAAGAFFLDAPEGAGSMAVSGATLGGTLLLLGLAASDVFRDEFSTQAFALFMLLGIDAGAAVGLALAPFTPLSRVETWFLDGGAAVGLGTAAALAFGLRAPTPAIGWGSMMVGTVVGAAAGVATAKLALPALRASFDDDTAGPAAALLPTVLVGARGAAVPALALTLPIP